MSFFRDTIFEHTNINIDWTSLVLHGNEARLGKYGYSLDHRPDKKQITVGVTEDGNESDCTRNTQAIKDLRESLGDDVEFYTYIADSKLVSLPNIREIDNGEEMENFSHSSPLIFT